MLLLDGHVRHNSISLTSLCLCVLILLAPDSSKKYGKYELKGRSKMMNEGIRSIA